MHPFTCRDRRVLVTGAASGVRAALLDVLGELEAGHVTELDQEFRQTAGDKINDWTIREMAGRAVEPREVATARAFLGSAASYVNGVNLDIDGGFGAAMATGQVDFSGRT